MELNDFLAHVAMRKPLDTPEIMELLNRMSDEARRITFELNGSYHTMDEIRALMSRLFGRPVYGFREKYPYRKRCVYQCLLPFPGPGWSDTGRRLPDWAQRGFRHT